MIHVPDKKVSQGSYSALVPAPTASRVDWTPRLIGALSDADRLVGRLAGEGGRLPDPNIVIRPFVQREAVLSSNIEGPQATLGELLAVEAGAIRRFIPIKHSPSNKASILSLSQGCRARYESLRDSSPAILGPHKQIFQVQSRAPPCRVVI